MTEAQWNCMPKIQRKKILREAGYAPNAYSARAFAFLPLGVRLDVGYVFLRQNPPVLQAA